MLEFQAANPFRIRAYRNGARAVRALAEPLSAIVEDEQPAHRHRRHRQGPG
ncbi:MAG: helix-hairpin-helix domain-containing protein [Pirellulales bacterium]